MIEPIKLIEKSDGSKAVNARDLHHFLVVESKSNEVGKMFSHWIKAKLDGFEKGFDYDVLEYDYQGNLITPIAKNGKPDNQRVNKRDYVLTMDCAKHISMLQKNDQGKKARQYFVDCEKKLKQQMPQSKLDWMKLAVATEERNQNLSIQNTLYLDKIQRDSSKVDFADAVSNSNDSILIRDFAKVISNSEFTIGQNKLFNWMRSNKYLMKDNTPYQEYIDRGYFKVIERIIERSEGNAISRTTKVTGKGQVFLTKRIRECFIKNN